eukprot:3058969-Prymnesium_polylepis.1
MGAADWNKVTHLDWQLMELNQADGPEMARELGSHKLLELKELYLYSNDLRDAGLRGLAPALTRQQMPKVGAAPDVGSDPNTHSYPAADAHSDC